MQTEHLDLGQNGLPAYRQSSTFYLRGGKRLLDSILAAAGLIVTSPLLLVCAVAIRIDSPGPAFFRQWRVGQHGRHYRIIKLRTMVRDAEQQGAKLTVSSDRRITTIGRWLRNHKLDEVPQLINVLQGEMSLVGPRPETPEHVACYSNTQKSVLNVRPGITGPTALKFIDEETILAGQSDVESYYLNILMPAKLECDLGYCRTASFAGDLRWILLTLKKLASS